MHCVPALPTVTLAELFGEADPSTPVIQIGIRRMSTLEEIDRAIRCTALPPAALKTARRHHDLLERIQATASDDTALREMLVSSAVQGISGAEKLCRRLIRANSERGH